MTVEKFHTYRDGLKINGLIYRDDEPCENNKKPVIIMSHGFTGNYTGFDFFAKKFYEYGFVSVCFNFCGGSSLDEFEGKSDGKSTDMTVSSEIEDLLEVVKYVKALSYTDNDNLYLMGESQGGFVSGLTAAKLQDEVKKLIMIFPATCIPDHARRGRLGGAEYDPKNPPEEMKLPYTIIGKKLHDDVYTMDPFSELAKYKGKVLVIHGTHDSVVNTAYSYLVKNEYEKDQCSLQIVRNMDHGFDDEMRSSLFASMRMFIEDKKELFSLRVICTHTDEVKREDKPVSEGYYCQDVYFNGYIESELFTGTIKDGGVDHQVYKDGKRESLTALYTLEGVDEESKECSLKVVNKWGENDWKPVIETDSHALSYLNGAEVTAVLEGGNLGPTIRFYM